MKLVPRAATAAPALDDAAILAAIRDGDPTAARALYHRARPQIERTMLRVLGRRDRDYEDIVQLSLVALVQSLPRFRGECSLDTWTSRVAAHIIYKHLRKRTADRRVFDDGASIDDAAVDSERALTARSLARRVRMHLDAMDTNKAWTVVLHDVCGHDLKEISEITECSLAAAQTRLSRGRIELHERIEADPELAGSVAVWEGRR